jgi:hypothetical protein
MGYEAPQKVSVKAQKPGPDSCDFYFPQCLRARQGARVSRQFLMERKGLCAFSCVCINKQPADDGEAVIRNNALSDATAVKKTQEKIPIVQSFF